MSSSAPRSSGDQEEIRYRKTPRHEPQQQHSRDSTNQFHSQCHHQDARRVNRGPIHHHHLHWFAKDYDPWRAGSIDGTIAAEHDKPHDKALVRAQKAQFDTSRDPNITGNAKCTLFVGRLNFATTEARLRQVFEPFGAIVKLRLVRDVVTNQSKGYAFIEFASADSFSRAFEQAHGMELDGRKILVDYERCRVMKGWKPRRLGGGLGGKKESGQLRFGGRDLPFRVPVALREELRRGQR